MFLMTNLTTFLFDKYGELFANPALSSSLMAHWVGGLGTKDVLIRHSEIVGLNLSSTEIQGVYSLSVLLYLNIRFLCLFVCILSTR